MLKSSYGEVWKNNGKKKEEKGKKKNRATHEMPPPIIVYGYPIYMYIYLSILLCRFLVALFLPVNTCTY